MPPAHTTPAHPSRVRAAQILALAALLAAPQAGAQAPELERRLAAAGEDTARLWDVRVWLEQAGRADEARAVLERILALDPAHAPAHRALAHRLHAGRWFETWVELDRFLQGEERRRLEERGEVRWQDRWVPEEDLVWLELGWEEQPDGSWIDPRVRARDEEDARRRAAGHERQDLTWLDPDEVEQARAGLYRCGDEWLPLAAADAYHAELGRWWRVPGEHFVVHTTLARATQGPEWAVWWADRTWDDLVRILGVAPARPPVVIVLRDLAQYNAFAAGDPARGRRASELDGSSSIHYAHYAQNWLEDLGQGPESTGSGVGWWDRDDPDLAPYGQHSIRHAAAHSFVEAIDPSLAALGDLLAGDLSTTEAFWAEKRLPRWLRMGAASYVERWFVDDQVEEGGDPRWARTWALDNLRARGGLRDLGAVFAMQLDPARPDESVQLVHESGLVVAFVLERLDEAVTRAHAELKRALAADGDVAPAAAALERALLEAEPALRAFAGE